MALRCVFSKCASIALSTQPLVLPCCKDCKILLILCRLSEAGAGQDQAKALLGRTLRLPVLPFTVAMYQQKFSRCKKKKVRKCMVKGRKVASLLVSIFESNFISTSSTYVDFGEFASPT